MSGFRNGYIVIDPPCVFYPGQVVSGKVVFELEQPFSLAALYVDFVGEAKVIWREKESEEYNSVKRYKEVEYLGREEYFNVSQLLAGGNAPVNLPPGTHTYEFSYQIPPGVPSSFSGERGGVTYCARATLDLKGQTFLKEVLTKFFEVVAPFDLNLGSPKLKDPIDFEFEEVAGCSCFGSGTINVRIRLPVSGYCPGQVIPVALEVDNTSNVEIRKIIFQILTRERYRTQRPISEYVPPEQVLVTTNKGSVMSGSKRNLTVEVKLPDLIAPNLENCGIIDVGYFFKATIKLSGCNDDLEDEAEICLGLIPLNETLNGEYIHPLSQSLPMGPIPDIPTNQEENRQVEAHQQSAYPGQITNSGFPTPAGYPTPAGFPTPAGYPTPAGFPTPAGYPTTNSNVQSSYFVQVQQQQYSSSDPSKNFNIGFTMTSPGELPSNFSNFSRFPDKDLRIHLPQPSFNVNTPSAPPPSS